MAIKMLTELGKRMDEHSKNFIKETEFIRVPVRAEEYSN